MKSMKKTARIAGLFYLLQIPLGVFGIMYIPKALIVPGDWQQTSDNILSNEFMFRLSMVSAILCAFVTVITAIYIRKVLAPVNPRYAKAIYVFALLVVPITLINELSNAGVLLLVKHSLGSQAFTPSQIQELVSVLLSVHAFGMQLIGIFFGLWLLPMGYLVITSTYIPRIIGYFLLLTFVGYILDFVFFFLLPSVPVVLSEFTWLGEVMMVSWLLAKGVKEEAFSKHMKELGREPL